MAPLASVLIIISSSLVSDIWEHGLHKQLTGHQEVFANRVVSAAVGLISLAIALNPPRPDPRHDRLLLGRDRQHQPLAPDLRPLREAHEQTRGAGLDDSGLPDGGLLDLGQAALGRARVYRGECGGAGSAVGTLADTTGTRFEIRAIIALG